MFWNFDPRYVSDEQSLVKIRRQQQQHVFLFVQLISLFLHIQNGIKWKKYKFI